MVGMEIIRTGENDHEETKEIILQNGSRIFVHSEKGYEDYYPAGRSFDDVTGEGSKLQFSHRAKIHRDGLKQLKEVDSGSITGNPLMLHHRHVQWIYLVHLQKEEANCRIRIESRGSSFRQEGATPKGGFGNNVPARQTAPKAEMMCWIVLEDGGLRPVKLKPKEDDWLAEDTLPLDLLMKLAQPLMEIQLQILVEKDYFEIKPMMENKFEEPERIAGTEKILETILKGDRPPNWDWVITVGETTDGQPREFFVHGQVLAYSSPVLEMAMKTHSSVGKDNLILMVSHEKRFILPQVHSIDMPVLLTYFYQRRFVLPHFSGFARVGRVLCALLPSYAIGNLFFSWQDALIQAAQKLNRKDWKKSLPELARLLVSLYSSPYGAMPIAKKVLVSTMADAWHMAEQEGVELGKEFASEEVFKLELLKNAEETVKRFALVAASVDKQVV